MPKIKPIKLVIIILCIAVIAVLAWKFLKPKEQQPQYITAEVTRGDIENNVLATGTLDATKLISVGAQVSGQKDVCTFGRSSETRSTYRTN